MSEKIKWVANRMPKSDDRHLGIMSLENVEAARSFHQSFPQYDVTPLAKLDAMAADLGLKNLAVKDESYRFGLNAFKVLGGSFAMANYIAGKIGRPVSDMTYDYLTSDELARDFGQATFFTATDGNHGRGVAWAANKLGQKAVVHMPKGSVKSRFDNIAAEGAEVTIEDVNYDECVRMAAAEAEACENGVIVQDTAWDGYEEIPSRAVRRGRRGAPDARLRAGRRGQPCRWRGGLLHQPLPRQPAHLCGDGGRHRGLPLQGRPGRRRRAPHRGRRHAHDHGGPRVRRAQHAGLGHPAQPRERLRCATT